MSQVGLVGLVGLVWLVGLVELGWLSWGEVKLGGGWEVGEVKTNVRFGILRFCRCQKWSHTPRLDLGHQRYNWVLKWVLVRNAAFCCARRCKI